MTMYYHDYEEWEDDTSVEEAESPPFHPKDDPELHCTLYGTEECHIQNETFMYPRDDTEEPAILLVHAERLTIEAQKVNGGHMAAALGATEQIVKAPVYLMETTDAKGGHLGTCFPITPVVHGKTLALLTYHQTEGTLRCNISSNVDLILYRAVRYLAKDVRVVCSFPERKVHCPLGGSHWVNCNDVALVEIEGLGNDDYWTPSVEAPPVGITVGVLGFPGSTNNNDPRTNKNIFRALHRTVTLGDILGPAGAPLPPNTYDKGYRDANGCHAGEAGFTPPLGMEFRDWRRYRDGNEGFWPPTKGFPPTTEYDMKTVDAFGSTLGSVYYPPPLPEHACHTATYALVCPHGATTNEGFSGGPVFNPDGWDGRSFRGVHTMGYRPESRSWLDKKGHNHFIPTTSPQIRELYLCVIQWYHDSNTDIPDDIAEYVNAVSPTPMPDWLEWDLRVPQNTPFPEKMVRALVAEAISMALAPPRPPSNPKHRSVYEARKAEYERRTEEWEPYLISTADVLVPKWHECARYFTAFAGERLSTCSPESDLNEMMHQSGMWWFPPYVKTHLSGKKFQWVSQEVIPIRVDCRLDN